VRLPIDRLIDALQPALPEPDRVATAELLDIGFSSTVVRVGDTVARIARNDDAAGGHRRQLALLPALAKHLSIIVPSDLRLVPPGEHLPFGALLSAYIPGRPMVRSDAADDARAASVFATVLAEIHSVPWTRLPADSFGSFEPVAELRRLEAETGAELQRRLTATDRRALEARMGSAFSLLPTGPTVFCHGDPWFGNFLVDDDGIPIALLDWEDACTGDSAMDFAAMHHLSRRTADDVVARYLVRMPADPSIDDRIELHRLVRELDGLAYVIRNDQHDEIDETVARLQELLAETR
jgi:aminoglycoside 2''-phosphotransferase